MAEQKKKSNRGDAFLSVEGTVGTAPQSNTIQTANGDLDLCSFRAVASPYRPGQKEPEDIWFTIRVAGNQTKYASQLNVGDVIAVRGGLSVREFQTKAGKPGIDLILNVDSSPNSLRRISVSKRANGNGEGTEAEPEAVAAAPVNESLF